MGSQFEQMSFFNLRCDRIKTYGKLESDIGADVYAACRFRIIDIQCVEDECVGRKYPVRSDKLCLVLLGYFRCHNRVKGYFLNCNF